MYYGPGWEFVYDSRVIAAKRRHVGLGGCSEERTTGLFCVGMASWTENCFVSGDSVARQRAKGRNREATGRRIPGAGEVLGVWSARKAAVPALLVRHKDRIFRSQESDDRSSSCLVASTSSGPGCTVPETKLRKEGHSRRLRSLFPISGYRWMRLTVLAKRGCAGVDMDAKTATGRTVTTTYATQQTLVPTVLSRLAVEGKPAVGETVVLNKISGQQEGHAVSSRIGER